MTSGRIRIVVFDFDGTLVDSNAGKRQAFFEIAGPEPRRRAILEEVLEEIGEESRYLILEEMLRREGNIPDDSTRSEQVAALARKYGDRVLEVAGACPEMPSARRVLEVFSARFPIYLSSTTPEDSLREVVARRGWTGFFTGIHGYPKRKPDTLRRIVAETGVCPDAILVVGDGESDRMAAGETGARFFAVDEPGSLGRLLDEIRAEESGDFAP